MTFATQSSPLPGRIPAFFGLFLLAASTRLPAASQPSTRKIQAETSFHSQANGTRLGALHAGATVSVRRTAGDWQQVTFEGWIFTASTGPSPRPEFSLAVSAPEGERIRAEPDGEVVARAIRGTGLTRLSRRGAWTQVRRSAWIRVAESRESRVASRETVPPPPAPSPPPAPAQAAASPTPALPASTRSSSGERVIVRKGASMSLGPGGAAVGTAPDGMQADVVERSGNWVRIRADAWVPAEDVVPVPPDSARITLEQLRADPSRFVGQQVTWRLQFLSVQTADELRPELPPGMPYLLTRGPLPEAGFVYVAVTQEQAQRFRAMSPLDEFVARGTIRAARTKYLPTPVIDLLR